jgi:putative SOS response-associated peptidase YedK
MCGRFTLTSTPEELARRFGLSEAPRCAPRYNVAPGQDVLAVRRGAESAAPRAGPLRWGLVPPWAEGPEVGARMINARAETVATKPAFRDAFRARRCIVPADGFYEWADRGGFTQPYWIGPRDGRLLGIAALWERWRSPAGDALESCALLTTAARGPVSELHDRMPAILAPAEYACWLDPAGDPADLADLLRPPADDALAFHPVGTRVNRVEVDDPSCAAPVPEPPRQPSLF